MEIIETEIKKKKAELEEENEEKIRKIVDEMLRTQLAEQKQNEKKTKEITSQILATFK